MLILYSHLRVQSGGSIVQFHLLSDFAQFELVSTFLSVLWPDTAEYFRCRWIDPNGGHLQRLEWLEVLY